MKTKIFLILSLLALASCELEELNENPNVPVDVPLSTLLPPAQKALADARGGRIFRYSNIFSQQLRGVDQQEALIENYSPDEIFIGDAWTDIYVSAMINLRIIIDRADAEGAPHYAGVARVLMANALGILTDVWGDVPYSEALRGAEFPNPRYDGQEQIYQQIDALLLRAKLDLAEPESARTPVADDLIYGGDLQAWSAAANLLRARYLMHTTRRNAQVFLEVQQALSESIFTSSADDLEYPYLGMGTDINPISSFYSITPYANIDPDFLELLEALNDPRNPFMFQIIPFSGGQRRPGAFYADPDAPIKLCSYTEMLFLQAEAALRAGTTGAQNLLDDAVSNSISEVSGDQVTDEDVQTYLADNVQFSGDFESDLNILITQKYIALFTTLEPWTDFRRTGYPALQPNAGGVSGSNPNGEIPRRLIYPQSERLRNTSFPSPAANMQERFWWDQ